MYTSHHHSWHSVHFSFKKSLILPGFLKTYVAEINLKLRIDSATILQNFIKGGAASELYYTSRDYQINIRQHGCDQKIRHTVEAVVIS